MKRRINRMLLLLTGGWAFCCILVYPLVQRQVAHTLYEHDSRACVLGSHDETLEHCLWVAQRESGLNEWSLTAFYKRESWRLGLIVIALPLVAYVFYSSATVLGSHALQNPKP